MSANIAQSLTLTLRGGRRVLLRPVRPSDRQRFIEGIRLMSMETRYFRFFSPVQELTDEQLRYLTEVDQINHVAWGAVDPDDPSFPGYGVARFVRTEEDHTIAEVAIAVIDDAQRQGLGTMLMSVLYNLAGLGGYGALRSIVLPGNRFMGDWLVQLGATKRLVDGVYELTHPVYTDFSELPDNPVARSFRKSLEEIRDLLIRSA